MAHLKSTVMFLLLAAVPALSQVKTPPIDSFYVAGFRLGLTQAQVDSVVENSTWSLQFRDTKSNTDTKQDFFHAEDSTFGVTCLGRGKSKSWGEECQHFDVVGVTTKSGICTDLLFWTKQFDAGDMAGVNEFVSLVTNQLMAKLGTPPILDFKPGTLTKANLKKSERETNPGHFSTLVAMWGWTVGPYKNSPSPYKGFVLVDRTGEGYTVSLGLSNVSAKH